ncbi:MAG: methyltransferase domain-containing protein [Thermodesulfobacteriota bacterium]
MSTPFEVVRAMLEVARVGPSDYLMDLGSGDGRIVVVAAESYGARAVGIERDADLVRESNENARQAGVTDRVEFREADLFATDMRGVSVLTMYLLPSVNLALRLRILDQLAPGARVVSHAFDMGDWLPDEHLVVGGADVYLWIVPANAAGTWRLTVAGEGGAPGASAEIEVLQRFQKVTVVARGASAPLRIAGAELRGDELSLDVVDRAGGGGRRRFTGRVADGEIVGGFGDGRPARLERLRAGKIATDRTARTAK